MEFHTEIFGCCGQSGPALYFVSNRLALTLVLNLNLCSRQLTVKLEPSLVSVTRLLILVRKSQFSRRKKWA